MKHLISLLILGAVIAFLVATGLARAEGVGDHTSIAPAPFG